ncbi:MAG TPA: alpha/beta hydrolase [Dehalococcoidia bacterium]|nr:alpha/beta hydrolase [Dehalococcoidia bacterium]
MPQPALLLIHGVASGAWVWDYWRARLRDLGWHANVLDVRGHGRSIPIDLSTTTMEDYVADVASVTQQIAAAQGVHPVIGGWSIGGMIAMMYVAQHPETTGLVLFEPSPPLEIGGKASGDVVRQFQGATLTPESFGLYPDDLERSRPRLFDLTDSEAESFLAQSSGATESGIAVRQNLRGISITQDTINCPALVVYGESVQRETTAAQNRRLAEHLKADTLAVAGAGHWGLVYSQSAVEQTAPLLDAWLRRVL